ncbi:MAG: S1C family serine protease [Alphaproteobacteria bacterium]|nr:S1C family serine protease [Alphaproteobacteria bacterium]
MMARALCKFRYVSWLCAGLVLACALALATQAARAQGSAQEVLAAVVGVRALVPEDARSARGLGTIRRGSGVLIDDEGHILTIGFLIMEAEDTFVLGPGDTPVKAKVVAYDWESGFGLLRAIDPIPAKPVAMGSAGGLSVQDPVVIAAHGGTEAVTPAFVVARREFSGYWEYLLEDAIFTAPLNQFHPGAALLAPDGKLLGIGYLALGDVTEAGRINPGNMFVPIDRLKPILADLKAHGRATGKAKPWLGLFTNETGGRVFITLVSKEGPGERAGINPGSIVLAVAGEKVSGQADFFRKVWAQGDAGTEVPLTILEGTDIREVTVKSADRYQWLRLKHSH